MQADYIVVGQGIAGSLLACELIRQEKRVIVYDTPEENSSSLIAAGMFNPITGRGFGKTWLADRLFPFLTRYYRDLERDLNATFFHLLPMYRPFLNVKDQNELISRANSEEMGMYIDEVRTESSDNFPVYDEFGGVFFKNTGYVDIRVLMDAVRAFIKKKGVYRHETFSDREIKIEKDKIRYGKVCANKVIFCNGLGASQGRYFRWLPFSPVKGEILFVNLQKPIKFIFNRQIFILPMDNELYKVGATYDRNNIDVATTDNAKKYLEEKLKRYINVKFTSYGQVAGIRPASRDRRPFIGLHPQFSNIGIFNGLGSKGVTLAPYFAVQFVEFLLKNKELDKEVNIKRFYYLNS